MLTPWIDGGFFIVIRKDVEMKRFSSENDFVFVGRTEMQSITLFRSTLSGSIPQ